MLNLGVAEYSTTTTQPSTGHRHTGTHPEHISILQQHSECSSVDACTCSESRIGWYSSCVWLLPTKACEGFSAVALSLAKAGLGLLSSTAWGGMAPRWQSSLAFPAPLGCCQKLMKNHISREWAVGPRQGQPRKPYVCGRAACPISSLFQTPCLF